MANSLKWITGIASVLATAAIVFFWAADLLAIRYAILLFGFPLALWFSYSHKKPLSFALVFALLSVCTIGMSWLTITYYDFNLLSGILSGMFIFAFLNAGIMAGFGLGWVLSNQCVGTTTN